MAQTNFLHLMKKVRSLLNEDFAKSSLSEDNPPKLEKNLLRWNKIGRYSQWMYNIFKPYVGRRVLDIGVGVGNMMQFFIKDSEIAIGTDIFDSQLKLVEERFQGYPIKTMVLDIEKDEVSTLQEYHLDTIICVNVLEHIENDLKALLNMKDIIIPGGRIILLVPALNKLYSYMDKNAGHHRRYDKGRLEGLAEKAQLKVLKHRYFNFLGIIPYALKGKSKGNGTFSTSLNETNSRLYNLASVIMEPIEKVIKIPVGLSELIILEK